MKVAVLGYGSQGSSAMEYWQKLGNKITVCDRDEKLELPDGITAQLGAGYLAGLDRFDLIVRSPSIHPRDIVAANSPDILEKVTTNTNEFMKICPTMNIIGVTGTKGKGTTSTLIAKMLEAAGYNVHLGGNIGTPPLEMLKSGIGSSDYVVLELANFQLIDLKYSPHLAVCVMVEPEHQDWHGNLEDYIRAKQQLFCWQKTDDIAIYYAENKLSSRVAAASKGVKIPYFASPGAFVADSKICIGETEICSVEQIGLLGEHNWQNICAAVTAVWQVTQDVTAISNVIRTLQGLPFRIEPIRELHDITFYNDSFATAPGATIAAIRAIRQPKVVIIGGHDRGLPLDTLVSEVATHSSNIRKVVAIGASGPRLAQAFEGIGFMNYELNPSKDMRSIVQTAYSLAQPGDAVLLSPSFASFDMFKNFEERGISFNEAVESLS